MLLPEFGSSPRLRGTDFRLAVFPYFRRFIPAPAAGNSLYPVLDSLRSPVHPRACGEQILFWVFGRSWGGSSPRLRGTAFPAAIETARKRFIPAPAGNSRLSSRRCSMRSVHPRACGEQGLVSMSPGSAVGSSPRLRGTAVQVRSQQRGIRFIPAPAGNRSALPPPRVTRSVHPRACGEQHPRASATAPDAGSSPRLRGTGAAREKRDALDWFIPAPAGNSLHALGLGLGPTVHPRACGEQRPSC